MNKICDDCALKLYNTKHYNLQGVGNPWNGICIVIPNVDYSAYKKGNLNFSEQVEIIKHIFSTGEEEQNNILDYVYIVPLIRCNETVSCPIDDITYNKCLHFLADDVRTYKFHDILLLGNACRRFLGINPGQYLNEIFISKKGIRYAVNYSPLVKLVNANLFDVFQKHLVNWYNSIINNNIMNNYEVTYI